MRIKENVDPSLLIYGGIGIRMSTGDSWPTEPEEVASLEEISSVNCFLGSQEPLPVNRGGESIDFPEYDYVVIRTLIYVQFASEIELVTRSEQIERHYGITSQLFRVTNAMSIIKIFGITLDCVFFFFLFFLFLFSRNKKFTRDESQALYLVSRNFGIVYILCKLKRFSRRT